MKIISRGVIPSEYVYNFACQLCKSILQCEQGEMEHHSDQREGEWWTVDCPVCHDLCYVHSHNRVKNNERNF